MTTQNAWIATFTGLRLNPFDPDPEMINIDDIAHGLSLTCRYAGQCKKFYSVAEHSIRLTRLVPEELRPVALMHDSAEAYMLDLPSLIKRVMPGYQAAEHNLLSVIFAKYDIDIQLLTRFLKEEYVLLATECRDLVTNTDGWFLPEPPLDKPIEPWTPRTAEVLFKNIFTALPSLKRQQQ